MRVTELRYFLLVLLVVVIGSGVETLWPWFPTVGVVCVVCYWIGRWSKDREVKQNDRAGLYFR